MFKAMYQTYGRTGEADLPGRAPGTSDDEVAARADAVRAVEEIGAFAVFGGPVLANAWTEELSGPRRDLHRLPRWSEPEPNIFTHPAVSSEQNRLQIVEYISEQAGRASRRSSPATRRCSTQERVFGHLYIEASEESAQSAADLRARLEAEGIALAEQLGYTLDPATPAGAGDAGSSPGSRTRASRRVVIQADPIAPSVFTQEATAQEYFPEWIIDRSTLIDTAAFGRTYDQQQWAHAFGVSRSPPGRRPASTDDALYEWFYGGPPPADDSDGVIIPARCDLLRRSAAGRARTSTPRPARGPAEPGAERRQGDHPARLLLRRPRPVPEAID